MIAPSCCVVPPLHSSRAAGGKKRSGKRSLPSGRRREIDAPEGWRGLEKFEGGGFSFGVNADDAALQVLLSLKIGEQDFLFGEDARADGDQSAVGAHVNGLRHFGKWLASQRAVEKYRRIQSDAMGAPLAEVAAARRCSTSGVRVRKRPAEETPSGFAGGFSF
jgi:hypothetical protein